MQNLAIPPEERKQNQMIWYLNERSTAIIMHALVTSKLVHRKAQYLIVTTKHYRTYYYSSQDATPGLLHGQHGLAGYLYTIELFSQQLLLFQ